MPMAKVAVALDREMLRVVDHWAAQGRYASRSQAFQEALREKLERWRRSRLASETAKLDMREERAMAEETLAGEAWPAY